MSVQYRPVFMRMGWRLVRVGRVALRTKAIKPTRDPVTGRSSLHRFTLTIEHADISAWWNTMNNEVTTLRVPVGVRRTIDVDVVMVRVAIEEPIGGHACAVVTMDPVGPPRVVRM